MTSIKPPNRPDYDKSVPSIFLAGSIEMNKAADWQSDITDTLKKYNCTIFNPRREHWDSSWEQKITNPQFKEQVTWELDHIDVADIVFFYIDPKTKSPISLMELGMVLATRKPGIIVCCPEGYWRKGNVDIICARYGIQVFEHLSVATLCLMKMINATTVIKKVTNAI